MISQPETVLAAVIMSDQVFPLWKELTVADQHGLILALTSSDFMNLQDYWDDHPEDQHRQGCIEIGSAIVLKCIAWLTVNGGPLRPPYNF